MDQTTLPGVVKIHLFNPEVLAEVVSLCREILPFGGVERHIM